MLWLRFAYSEEYSCPPRLDLGLIAASLEQNQGSVKLGVSVEWHYFKPMIGGFSGAY